MVGRKLIHLTKGWVFGRVHGTPDARWKLTEVCVRITYLGAWSGMNEGSEMKAEGDDNKERCMASFG